MSDMYFYRILGQEFGPVVFDALKQVVTSGQLGLDDEFRLQSETNWRLVESHPELVAAANGESEEQRDEPSGLADSVPERLRQCYCQSLGQTLGPMLMSDLMEMVRIQEIGPRDKVRVGESGPWQDAADLHELTGLFDRDELAAVATSTAPAKPQSTDDPTDFDLGRAGDRDTLASADDDTDFDLAGGFSSEPSAKKQKQQAKPPAVAAPPQTDADKPATVSRWFVKFGSDEFGPVDLETLKLWRNEGRVLASTILRADGSTDEIRADSLKEVFASSPAPAPAKPPAPADVKASPGPEPPQPAPATDSKPTDSSEAKSTETTEGAVAKKSSAPEEAPSAYANLGPRPPVLAKIEKEPLADRWRETLTTPSTLVGLVLIGLYLLWLSVPYVMAMFEPDKRTTLDRLVAIHTELKTRREAGTAAAYADGVKAEVDEIAQQIADSGANSDTPLKQYLLFCSRDHLPAMLAKPDENDPRLELSFERDAKFVERLLDGKTVQEATELEMKDEQQRAAESLRETK